MYYVSRTGSLGPCSRLLLSICSEIVSLTLSVLAVPLYNFYFMLSNFRVLKILSNLRVLKILSNLRVLKILSNLRVLKILSNSTIYSKLHCNTMCTVYHCVMSSYILRITYFQVLCNFVHYALAVFSLLKVLLATLTTPYCHKSQPQVIKWILTVVWLLGMCSCIYMYM